jgi:hypothetical protein
VQFVEGIAVAEGVRCFTYRLNNDNSRDLALVHVKGGSKTPLQRVVQSNRTTEGYIDGRGTLTVGLESGEDHIYVFPDSDTNQGYRYHRSDYAMGCSC